MGVVQVKRKFRLKAVTEVPKGRDNLDCLDFYFNSRKEAEDVAINLVKEYPGFVVEVVLLLSSFSVEVNKVEYVKERNSQRVEK